MNWKDKTVLVTGAGGFIGSHLTEALATDGARVRALVHYNSQGSIGNLRFLPAALLETVTVVPGDITDAGCVDVAVAGCDCVFHLAALIGIPYSYHAPRSYVATNVAGTQNVLEAIRRHRVPRLVHTSTSECYGTARYVPIDEKHPLQGQSPYSASKIGADKLAESYHLSFDLPIATVRPFNTYGPRQSARAIIPTIASQLLAGRTEIELGALDPERDLTFVGDTVRGFLLAADSAAAIGQVTNLGTGSAVSIGELAGRLISLVNPEARIVSRPERMRPAASEVMRLVCAAGKAAERFDWRPSVTLDEGLARTIEFVRNHPELFRPGRYAI